MRIDELVIRLHEYSCSNLVDFNKAFKELKGEHKLKEEFRSVGRRLVFDDQVLNYSVDYLDLLKQEKISSNLSNQNSSEKNLSQMAIKLNKLPGHKMIEHLTDLNCFVVKNPLTGMCHAVNIKNKKPICTCSGPKKCFHLLSVNQILDNEELKVNYKSMDIIEQTTKMHCLVKPGYKGATQNYPQFSNESKVCNKAVDLF